MEQVKQANAGKELNIEVDGALWSRIPIKTHLLSHEDSVTSVFSTYVAPVAEKGDIAFFSESALACVQKRFVHPRDIQARFLARILCKFVTKNPAGDGLGMPETMEMAFRECGTVRILLASAASAIGKLFGKRGWFFHVAGDKARSIDGPCPGAIPPYNECVVLAPININEAAAEAAKAAGCPVAIVDVNDLGREILGISDESIDRQWLLNLLADNPLGQEDQQTPIGIIRAAKCV